MPERFDLAVIGAGGAGSTVAFDAVNRNVRVALIERWKVGGTCLNAGCDPTKTLVRSAEIAHLARHADRYGIEIPDFAVNWAVVMDRVARVIDTIRGGDGDVNVRNAGIALFKNHARFRDGNTLILEDGQIIYADRIVVATGAAERIPTIDGLMETGYITNVEAVALPELPESLAIIGGGVIAVEFAQIFARFGVEVTILGSSDHLLPKEEPALADALQAVLEHEGIRVETGVRVTHVDRDGERKILRAEGDGPVRTWNAGEILLAAGRSPVVDGLDLENAGVEYSAKDGIAVDAQLRTTAPNIWAVGDVTNVYPFTHVADYQARIAEHNALSGEDPLEADYSAIPWATFTDPELSRVGMTEDEAKAAGHDVVSATVQMKDLARAITSGETAGMVKLVADRKTGKILGGHVLAANGGELIAEVALAMRTELVVQEIGKTVHAYPTMSEAVFWTAYELSKPPMPSFTDVRGIQAPAGEVLDDL
jgi:pyruvate/2-oxoglutarate dehydrogenase complex dihydrolipoamide dehydrogenase (E3) component